MDAADLTTTIRAAIAQSVADIQAKHPDDPIARYAICTDDDLRTLYATACTRTQVGRFENASRSFVPAEWFRGIEHYAQLDAASSLLSRLADAHYEEEDDGIDPDADHLRPWKAELFAAVVAGLSAHRESGTFGSEVFLIATSHDPGEWLGAQVDEATKTLNSAELYESWRSATGRS